MIFLRQSTASQEVLLGPFLDDTDGKTAETALSIANTDIKIWKEGGTTESSKNSGGATHIASGRYYATLDSTDTNTVGNLLINVHVSGALPVRLECYVLEEAVYDALFASGAAGYQVPIWANASSTVNLSGTTIKTLTDAPSDSSGVTTLLSRVTASVMLASSYTAPPSAATIATQVRTELGVELARIDAAISTRLAPTTAGRTLDVNADGEAGIDWGNIGNVTATVNMTGTTIKTATDVETKTSDIQSRIPAALTAGGNMKSDALAIDGSTSAAALLVKSLGGIAYGTVGVGSTVTSVVTSAMTPAGVDASQFIGRAIIFLSDTTTTALRSQASTVRSSTGAALPVLGIDNITRAPQSGDTFVVL